MRTNWVEHVARMVEKRNFYGILMEKFRGGGGWGDKKRLKD